MSGADTIYALSSGSPPAGIAVIRVSGPSAERVLVDLTGAAPAARHARLSRLRGGDGALLDEALTLFFPENGSFTGEPVVELHCHGGPAVVRAVLDALAAYPDTRAADPGEFTRRAFVNGRLDLTAAEGVGDLIAAETEVQRRLAVSNAAGAQSDLYSGWRRQLVEARALVEADLDFADESDVPGSVADQVESQVRDIAAAIEQHLSLARLGEIIQGGYRVALIGEPNAGKSSLLNALAKRDVAIVSDIPGTTRDALSVALDLQGYKVVVTDTAGLRDTDDPVERLGIQRTFKELQQADLVLHLHPAGSARPASVAGDTVAVATKADLSPSAPAAGLKLSVVTGEGLDELVLFLGQRAKSSVGSISLLPTQSRHIHHLRSCVTSLQAAVGGGLPLELQAEELRLAADALGRITGAIGVEDLLDVIFSRFCIGK